MAALSWRGHRSQLLLQYIIAYREHQEFHEQCVERIFADIYRVVRRSFCTVQAFYTRRGGLDINPFAAPTLMRGPSALIDSRLWLASKLRPRRDWQAAVLWYDARPHGEVAEWSKAHAWKVCIRQRIEGSNPSLTAK